LLQETTYPIRNRERNSWQDGLLAVCAVAMPVYIILWGLFLTNSILLPFASSEGKLVLVNSRIPYRAEVILVLMITLDHGAVSTPEKQKFFDLAFYS
jgi:hypothetical protein